MGKRKKQGKDKQPKNTWDDKGFGNNPFKQLADQDTAQHSEAQPEPQAATKTPTYAKPRRAVVRTQRKGRGGKTVTVLSHLGISKPETLEHWCKHMCKQLGCGGSVEEDEIVLQGDQRARLQGVLEGIGVERITGL